MLLAYTMNPPVDANLKDIGGHWNNKRMLKPLAQINKHFSYTGRHHPIATTQRHTLSLLPFSSFATKILVPEIIGQTKGAARSSNAAASKDLRFKWCNDLQNNMKIVMIKTICPVTRRC
jgi:hypothetical protein